MECTQKLEFTEDLYSSHYEKVFPEQVGFLGICGTVYPLKKGPNKIGRDPQTCSIVLNLNSISRQHAVINILNKQDFMLMDLDSSNKTKLKSKTLPPYIAHPLRNGDTVQFGDIFGIFRLLEEECDLPMTQDIPETPVFNKHASKLFHAPKTLVPESPDVSDKDESFIIASQKPDTSDFKSPKPNFIKPSGKTLSIGGDKNDNVFWNSKKSLSLNASDICANNSRLADVDNEKEHNVSKDIHELETQVPYPKEIDESTDSIYSANTQLVSEQPCVPSIHDMTTQLPFPTEKLPQVCKIINQEEMQCDIFTNNKENENIFFAETQQVIVVKDKNKINSIFDAETQVFGHTTTESNIHDLETQQISLNLSPKKDTLFDAETQEPHIFKASQEKVDRCSDNKSKLIEDEILFDDLDSESFEENFESQNILSENIIPIHIETKVEEVRNVVDIEPDDDLLTQSQPIKRANRKVNQIDSDNSTDCEDIDMLPTQQIFDKDGDETNCEVVENNLNDIKAKENVSKPHEEDFNDMTTQMLDDEEFENINMLKTSEKVSINEMATQKIDGENTLQKDINFDEVATQIIFDTFKVPAVSPKKYKKRESVTSEKPSPNKQIESKPSTSKDEDDEIYYAATQELYEDLCSQKELADDNNDENVQINKDCVPCSIEEFIGERFPYLDGSPVKKVSLGSDKSPISDGGEITKYVAGLSTAQIYDVVGVDVKTAKLKKISSETSDLEDTPKKVFNLLDADLPNSQDIETNVARQRNHVNPETESSSESDVEQESQECTPVVNKIKKKGKTNAKVDLMKRLNVDSLPTRVITRVRKPVAKLLESDKQCQKSAERILKPKFMTELDCSIDSDIITENIRRFKDLKEKAKIKKGRNDKTSNNAAPTTSESKLETTLTKTEDKKDVQVKSKPTRSYTRNKKQDKEQQEKTTSPKEEPKVNKSETLTVIEKEKSPRSSRRRKEADKNKDKSKSEKQNKSKSPENDSKPKPTVEKRKRGRPRKDEKTEKREEKESKPSRHHKKESNTSKHEKDFKKSESTDTTRLGKEVDKKSEPTKTRRHQKEKDKQKETRNTEAPKVIQSRSILKRSLDKSGFEQSTVYNISSASDEPVLKRQGSDVSNPASKKSRSMDSSSNKSLRSTPARRNKSHKVLFTAFSLEVLTEVKGKLEKLGAETVTNVTECTVLVTQQIKRTFKLLCAVGLGRPIVGPSWVQACVDSNIIVDPWLYIIKDEAAERRFAFSLQRTLASKRYYLRGYNVTSTPSVLPSAMEMKLIVECSGGTWLEGGPRWIAVSCAADRAVWPILVQGGATVVSTEFILQGVLKQKLDVEAYKLC